METNLMLTIRDNVCICGVEADRVGAKLGRHWHYWWLCPKCGRRWGRQTQTQIVPVLEDEAADAMAMIGGKA